MVSSSCRRGWCQWSGERFDTLGYPRGDNRPGGAIFPAVAWDRPVLNLQGGVQCQLGVVMGSCGFARVLVLPLVERHDAGGRPKWRPRVPGFGLGDDPLGFTVIMCSPNGSGGGFSGKGRWKFSFMRRRNPVSEGLRADSFL